jgi:hypothetical protein
MTDHHTRGMRLEFLPPYSPDYNPIEQGFSAMKAWIRRHRDYALNELSGIEGTDPLGMLLQAVYTAMTPDNIYGWYMDSGYI